MEENLNSLDFALLEEIAGNMMAAQHIYIWEIGYSGKLAEGLQLRLRAIMSNISASSDDFRIIQDSYRVQSEDIVIAISFTGNTQIVKNVLRARESGAKIIAFTGSYDNKLYHHSDIQIVPASYFKDHKSRYIGNEMIIKIIFDSLYVYIENEMHNIEKGDNQTFLHHFEKSDYIQEDH